MQQYKLIQTLLDPVTNFGKVTVSTGYSSTDIIIVLDTGHGDRLPNPSIGPFNLVWWNSTDYLDPSDDPYVEIVRVTALTGDILTIERPQEGTAQTDKNLPGKTYKMILSLTAKMIPDIQSDAQSRVDVHRTSDTHTLPQPANIFTNFQDVTISRAIGTTYQNTTGKVMMITVSFAGDSNLQILVAETDSSSPPTTIVAQGSVWQTASRNSVTFLVQPGHYYRTRNTGGYYISLQKWIEWY